MTKFGASAAAAALWLPTWLYDLTALRTVGTFFGLGADGTVRTAPGGAVVTVLGRVAYPDEQPV